MATTEPGGSPSGPRRRPQSASPARTGRGRRSRRRLVLIGVAAVVALAAVLGGPGLYARFLAPEAPSALGLSSTADPAGDQSTSSDAVAGPVEDGTWEVGEGSEAGYRLDEVLSGQPVTVVGRTDQVTGSLVVEDEMLVSAEVVVDVASIATDEPARDGFFRRALRVTEVPEATFTLTEPVDLAGLGADGTLTVDAVGTLTLNDVTEPATVSLDARLNGDGVEVAGQIPVVLTDHGLTAPDLGFVKVEPEGLVEMRLVLGR